MVLKHELDAGEGILVVRPEDPLTAADFETLTTQVDDYIHRNGTLKGLMIVAKAFPGWEDVAGFVSHFRFVKDHHRIIKKVAIVSDSELLTVLPKVAAHFVSAEIEHFSGREERAARTWLSS
jgi:SpoIIAA-like